MLKLPHLLAALWALALGACAVSEVNPVPRADYDPGTDFASYRSFAWQTPDPFVISTTRPLAPATRDLMLEETAAHLQRKGLKQLDDPTTADLLVSIVIGSRSGLRVNNYPGRWGGNYSDPRDTTTGGIGVELFSADTGQRLWTGWATTGLTEEVYADREAVVKQIVAAVLEQYPPDG